MFYKIVLMRPFLLFVSEMEKSMVNDLVMFVGLMAVVSLVCTMVLYFLCQFRRYVRREQLEWESFSVWAERMEAKVNMVLREVFASGAERRMQMRNALRRNVGSLERLEEILEVEEHAV